MIYITGDTHGSLDIDKLSFTMLDDLTKDDYVIVCGDFGMVWFDDATQRYWLDWLERRPYTTLFVDGNHEGFERLNALPVEAWNGGLVHRAGPSVLHLMRGQIFDIEGKSFFAMGGAHSAPLDKAGRIPGVSWFEEEVPCYIEREHALEVLAEHGWKVDFVLSHCAPTAAVEALMYRTDAHPRDEYTDWLQEHVADRLEFKTWFFGHYHIDKAVLGRYQCLYNRVHDLRTGKLHPSILKACKVMEYGELELFPESALDWDLYLRHEDDGDYDILVGRRYSRKRGELLDVDDGCAVIRYEDCFVNGWREL